MTHPEVNADDFVRDLERLRDDRLRDLSAGGRTDAAGPADAAAQVQLLKIALANEIGVSELAAAWMPVTPEVDVKIALARQAGDEARHFTLVGERLRDLGFDPAEFSPPPANPLFEYLKGLPTTVERIAAGLFTLEAIAGIVNDAFMTLCERRGDHETARLYRDCIQPDERAHQAAGRALLVKYAVTPDTQARARAAVLKTLEIAGTLRALAAGRIGTACFPGC